MNPSVKRRIARIIDGGGIFQEALGLDRLLARRAHVLCYHRVCAAPPEEALQYYNVQPSDFARQLDHLVKLKCNVVTARTLLNRLVRREPLPSRTVVITFDDGYRNNYTHAFPLLAERGLPATFFVTTGYVESAEPFPWLATDRAIEQAGGADPTIWEPIRWSELREMEGHGMEVGSHSHSHPQFMELDESQMVNEVRTSRHALEQHGLTATTFASSYATFGRAATTLAKVVNQEGFTGAFLGRSGGVGSDPDLYDLPRVPIDERDTVQVAMRKALGLYDWTAPLRPAWVRLSDATSKHGTP